MEFWKKAGPNLIALGALVLLIGLIVISDGNTPVVAWIGGATMIAGLSLRAAHHELPETD